MHDHLKKTGSVNCSGEWISHTLTLQNMLVRISACDYFLKLNEKALFFQMAFYWREKMNTLYNVIMKILCGQMNLPKCHREEA